MHKNMHYKKIIIDIFAVTFRKEGVDWNQIEVYSNTSQLGHLPQGRCGLKSEGTIRSWKKRYVTFRKEGVDWNLPYLRHFSGIDVTFLTEGVD